MTAQEVDAAAQIVWDYHRLRHEPKPADLILALGSRDLRVAERSARLMLEGWAPLLVCSGGLGRVTRGLWEEPEAEKFARLALRAGVPEARVLIENRSANTGENISFTRELLARRGLAPRRLILVHKPYMERRAYATCARLWPDVELIITSPQISFADYPNDEISRDEVIAIMLGDLQRIKVYPDLGFQIPQIIPDEVWQAYQTLVGLGYTKHLLRAPSAI